MVQDVVGREGGKDFDATWVCMLKHIPAFVHALDAAPIHHNILMWTRKAAFPDVLKLFVMSLGPRTIKCTGEH